MAAVIDGNKRGARIMRGINVDEVPDMPLTFLDINMQYVRVAAYGKSLFLVGELLVSPEFAELLAAQSYNTVPASFFVGQKVGEMSMLW